MRGEASDRMIGRWQEWFADGSPLLVSAGEVHVFRTRLDFEERSLAPLRAFLSPEETARAARLAFPVDRRRFIAAHGLLRALLGSCLGLDPRAIAFKRDPRGKPRIASPRAGAWLRFSMSVSGDTALYALSRERDVGIDVERRLAISIEDILKAGVLPDDVRSRLDALAPAQKRNAFYDCWVRHEARGKAGGWGLLEPAPEARRRWTVFDCSPAPSFAGACAVEGDVAALVRHAVEWAAPHGPAAP